MPAEDGVVAARLARTGAVLLGKTNTPHLGHKDSCDNLLGPPCRNPWNLDRTSGGSSGGAGSAIAAGLGPLAHGSDGGGSIRIPAALCGVFGLKPSFGRVPGYPSADYWSARAHHGPLARDRARRRAAAPGDGRPRPARPAQHRCAARGLPGGLRRRPPGLSVAWSADLGYAPVDPEVRRIAEAAALRFTELGATVEARDPDWPDPGAFHKVICDVANASRHLDRATQRPEWIEPSLMRMIEDGRRVSGVEHARALAERSAFYDQAPPVLRGLRPPADAAAAGGRPGQPSRARVRTRARPRSAAGPPRASSTGCGFTFPFNLTGQPAASVPCGFTADGLPVGLQIVGRWHADALVLRAAAAFEALQPWASRRPALD